MSEEMPERIEVIMTGPKDVFGWVFGKYDGTLQATEYVRADRVKGLQLSLRRLVDAIGAFVEAYARYWYLTAGSRPPTAVHDQGLELENALADAARILDRTKEESGE